MMNIYNNTIVIQVRRYSLIKLLSVWDLLKQNSNVRMNFKDTLKRIWLKCSPQFIIKHSNEFSVFSWVGNFDRMAVDRHLLIRIDSFAKIFHFNSFDSINVHS